MYAVQRPLSLRQQALQQLRHAIVTGNLEPGSLHSEQTLATRMAISRTPVREAMLQLEQEGLIEFLPQRGARVRDFDPAHLSHVFELRAALEGYCAGMLARNHDADVVARLEAELSRQQKIIRSDNGLDWVIANMEFHIMLVSSLGNPLFTDAMPPLASHTMRIGYRMNARRERMSESLQEHTAIVDAIRARDESRARSLAVSHLYITTVLMRQLFNDLGLGLAGPGQPEGRIGGGKPPKAKRLTRQKRS